MVVFIDCGSGRWSVAGRRNRVDDLRL